MRASMQFRRPSNRDDLVIAIVALVFGLLIMSSIGCISAPKSRAPEPRWAPALYEYRPQNNRCVFYNPSSKHSIDCDEPLIYEYILIHADYVTSLNEKFDACQEWR